MTTRAQLTDQLIDLTAGRFFTITWDRLDGKRRTMHAQVVRLKQYNGAPRPVDGQRWLRDLQKPKGKQLRTVVLDNVLKIQCGPHVKFNVL